jgi:hypothetical protein
LKNTMIPSPENWSSGAVRNRISRTGDRVVLSLSHRSLLECGMEPMDRRH